MEQYGYRPGHSTELVRDNLTKQVDSGKLTITGYIDLSKAFDTILLLLCA